MADTDAELMRRGIQPDPAVRMMIEACARILEETSSIDLDAWEREQYAKLAEGQN